jgi:hypothetical protein
MSQQLIEQAIRGKALIEFTYSDHHRVVEPHVLGLKDGVIQFLGYQIGGTSSSGGALPEWRRFDVVKILRLVVTANLFHGRRPFPSGRHSVWDRQILIVDP